MKNFLKYVAALAIVGAFFVACSDWTDPEREITQHPDQQSPILRDNAYYQALREYKKTKHKIAFGWYGSWTAVGASYQTRLQSAPDSMDIISIWSQWHSLTPEQIADKEFVQKIKGTKGRKYYYKARVLVYDGSELVARSALKQCSYGART